MEDISLHILDIVENSLNAGAKNIEIKLTEDRKKNLLTLKIKDDGCGMGKETLKNCLDPFFTADKRKKTGLGLSLLSQSAKESGGEVKVISSKGEGTTVIATFRLNNIDTKPKGDINETINVLKATHKDIKFTYKMEVE